MTPSIENDHLLASARHRLLKAVDYLRKVDDPGRAVHHSALAVGEILKAACEVDDLARHFPDLTRAASTLVAEACVVVAAEADAPSPEQIYFGFGRVNELLTSAAPPSRVWLIDTVGIFVAELTISMHRQNIRRRGQTLFEHVVAHFEMTRAANDGAALH